MSGPPLGEARADAPAAATPYRLLWSTALAAGLLALAAVALWGRDGAGMLLDMIVALCM